jgi:predicted MFS family arabinose efflux permease
MKRSVAWATWSLATLFYAYQYILRVAPNVLKDDIMSKYAIDDRIFGQYAGTYYLGYSLIHIPLGLLLDRFGPKRIMPIFLMLSIIGMAPLAFTDFWAYPIIGRVLVGIGSSSAILGVFKIIRMTFDASKFTWMLSISVTIGLLGAIFGGAPLNALHASMGLENIVLVLMAAGTALAILLYFVTPQITHQKSDVNLWGEVKAVMTNRYVLAVCLLSGLMVGPLEGFADAWAKSFLKSVYGFSNETAAGLPSWIFIGMCFGGPTLSLLAKKVKNDLLVVLFCGLVMMLAFLGIITATIPASVLVLRAVFFVVGLMCAYQILTIGNVSIKVPPQFAGLTSAVANMLIMIFGYLFHTSIGFILFLFSGVDDTNAVYSSDAMFYAIGIIPAALMVACIGFGVLSFTQRHK